MPPIGSAVARRLAAAAALAAFLAGCAAWPGGRAVRVLRFSGEDWIVRSTGGRALAPGPNVFFDGPEAASVDDRGRLHLRVARDGGVWRCAEIVSRRAYGRGTYRFEVATPPSRLTPGVVLGLFTWNDAREPDHREIDVELSSAPAEGETDAQFVVQPGADAGTIHRFRLPPDAGDARHSFRLLPGRVEFESRPLGGPDFSEVWTSSAAPDGGSANVRMNLWLARGAPLRDGESAEAIVTRFEFVPDE
jgi:hypothetical protein